MKENIYTMIVEPEAEVELLDDTASTTVLVRFEGNVYQISREQTGAYTSDKTAENAKNNPSKYAAEGVRIKNFLENSQIVPGIKERQPEGLWEKANRMDPCAPHDCRMAFRDIKMPSSAVPIWEMIAAYDLEKLPAWINGDADVRFARGKSPQALKQITWEEENKTTVGIVDYTSLRPEFAKWDVRIKTGNPTYTCGVVTAQDTLEYLWSKRMGFPVKADAALIRKKWDDNNAKSGRNAIRKGKGSPEDPMGEGTDNWIWDYLASDGGYSVLTPESRAKIPATALPKLVTRQLCLGYQDNQGFHNPPLTALMVDELKKGHVIVASGAQAGPKQSSAKSKIQSVNGSSNPSYPFPRMDADPNLSRSHDQLITGYYVQYDLSAFPKSGGLFWEFRGNWGYTYGDHGYAYIPDGDLGEVYKTALFSVALE